MSFSKSLFSSTVLAGTVFTAALAPLVLFGAQPLTVLVGQRPVFTGQLHDLSKPYMGTAAAASVGVGLSAIALAGWRRASRHVSQAEKQLSELDQQIQEKEALIEELAFSEAKLKALGLEAFLQQESAPRHLPAALASLERRAGSLSEHSLSEHSEKRPDQPQNHRRSQGQYRDLAELLAAKS